MNDFPLVVTVILFTIFLLLCVAAVLDIRDDERGEG